MDSENRFPQRFRNRGVREHDLADIGYAHLHLDHGGGRDDELARWVADRMDSQDSPNRAPASTFTIPVPPSCSTRNLPATAMGTTDFLYSIPRALTSSSVLPTEETSG